MYYKKVFDTKIICFFQLVFLPIINYKNSIWLVSDTRSFLSRSKLMVTSSFGLWQNYPLTTGQADMNKKCPNCFKSTVEKKKTVLHNLKQQSPR